MLELDTSKLSNEELKEAIKGLTREYSNRVHGQLRPGYEEVSFPFVAGETTVPYAARVFCENEVEAAVGATLDFWLTLGRNGDKFERSFADWLGVRSTRLVNSGSSANLVAIASLTSAKLPAERRLRPGDEVITSASGFPTTVAPILQQGMCAVFVDADPTTGNLCCDQLEEAFSEGKTKAVIAAHALGNPFDLSSVVQFCRKRDLWLIEDNCDSLGATYTMANSSTLGEEFHGARLTGTFGDLSTQSFYPPHHMTMGEGGAVNIVRNVLYTRLVESFRDWGRDCWCPSGKDNTCNKRFEWQLGDLPEGYDHKYIYSHLGYNLKPLDIQAAIGLAQLQKLPDFIQARSSNWQTLRKGLSHLGEFFDFALPTHAKAWNQDGSFEWDDTGNRTNCSWFGFAIRVKQEAPFSRLEFARYLDSRKIGFRMLFGGNLARQPAFVQAKLDSPSSIRMIGNLTGADDIMNRSLFLGTYPGLTPAMLSYVIESISDFVENKVHRVGRLT